jgi:hypothetical protein
VRDLRRAPGALIALGPAKAWAFLEALVLLPAAAAALRRWGYNRVRAWLLRLPGAAPAPKGGADPAVVVGDVWAMVHLAARRGPWRPNCLQRSITLWWLLHRRGVATELRFGVRPGAGGGVPAFHAWVEREGRVLNDRADIAREYLPFGGVPPTLMMDGG